MQVSPTAGPRTGFIVPGGASPLQSRRVGSPPLTAGSTPLVAQDAISLLFTISIFDMWLTLAVAFGTSSWKTPVLSCSLCTNTLWVFFFYDGLSSHLPTDLSLNLCSVNKFWFKFTWPHLPLLSFQKSDVINS